MGIVRNLAEHAVKTKAANGESSDRVDTIWNLVTGLRPILADIAGRKLMRGEKGVKPWFIGMVVSDAEGFGGRFGDMIAPGSFIGTSSVGAKADPIADTLALLRYSWAALRSPKMPKLSKVAIGMVLAHEGLKAGWAINKNHEYKQASGEGLEIAATVNGKISIVEKMFALGFATLAYEAEDPGKRVMLSLAAIGVAFDGVRRAERERQQYDVIADNMIYQATRSPIQV